MRRAFILIFVLIMGVAPLGAEPDHAQEEDILAKVASRRQSAPTADIQSLAAKLEAAILAWRGVTDYEAFFEKKEKDGPALGESERIFFKFRKPFKVFMGWLTSAKKGLQVVYERGRHDNKLAIHKPGLFFGLAQVVFLDQKSPWVREGSESFDIEDAGIGTFLWDFSRAVVKAAEEGKLAVRASSPDHFDVSFPGTAETDDDYFAWRVEVAFDPSNHLPTEMRLFDWKNEPIGFYAYRDLRLNVGEDSPAFKKEINRRLYSVYAGR